MSHELNAKAVLLFDGKGQIHGRSGWLEESHFPAMAALAAAMISAGQSLGELGDSFGGDSPSRFSCDSSSIGLYTVAVGNDLWLTTLYDQPLNPGKFRMRVRRFAETFARIQGGDLSVSLAPLEPENLTPLENLTEKDSTLFANITDDEIDRLFENPSS